MLTHGDFKFLLPISFNSSNEYNLIFNSFALLRACSLIESIIIMNSKFDFDFINCNALSESSHTTSFNSALFIFKIN